MEKQRGFTLLEALVVIIITMVLAALSMPKLLLFFESNRAKRVKAGLMDIYASQKRYAVYNNGNYANLAANLDLDPSYIEQVLNPSPTVAPVPYSPETNSVSGNYFIGDGTNAPFQNNCLGGGNLLVPAGTLAWGCKAVDFLFFYDYSYALSVNASGVVSCSDTATAPVCGKLGF